MTTTYTPTRPIMTAAELRGHQIDAYGRNYAESDDGYDEMEANGGRGWRALPAWGADGWDLGDWPYVVLSMRRHPGAPEQDLAPCWELLSVCEGDHTVYRFQTRADLDAAIDYLFLWYAAGRGYDEFTAAGITYETRSALDAGTLRVPEKFRGPYRRTV